MQRSGLLQQRLNYPPGLLNRVLLGEELSAPVQGVVEESLVGLGILARDFLKQNLEVGWLKRLNPRPLGEEAQARPCLGVDPDCHLVLPGALARPHPQRRRALESDARPQLR